LAAANTYFGVITVLTGLTGTMIGGWLGDYFQKKTNKGYVLVSGWGLLLGVPFAVYALITPVLGSCLTAIFFAEFFLFLNTGPLNTVIVNVTHPAIRARAFALNIFIIHALGDAVSPTVLGWLSDLWGLTHSLLITPGVIALASFFCFLCGRFLGKDNVRV
jgi:MFS family permease